MNGSIKVIITGEKGVGVSTLIEKDFNLLKFNDDTLRTIGVNFYFRQTDFTEEFLPIQFWQLARDYRFRLSWKYYFAGTDIGILLVDLTRRETFSTVKKIVRELWEEVGLIPIILLGNKMDLKDIDSNFMDKGEIEEYCQEITQKVGEEGFEVKFFPISAKTRQNVPEVIEYLDKLCLEVSRRKWYGDFEKIKVKFKEDEVKEEDKHDEQKEIEKKKN